MGKTQREKWIHYQVCAHFIYSYAYFHNNSEWDWIFLARFHFPLLIPHHILSLTWDPHMQSKGSRNLRKVETRTQNFHIFFCCLFYSSALLRTFIVCPLRRQTRKLHLPCACSNDKTLRAKFFLFRSLSPSLSLFECSEVKMRIIKMISVERVKTKSKETLFHFHAALHTNNTFWYVKGRAREVICKVLSILHYTTFLCFSPKNKREGAVDLMKFFKGAPTLQLTNYVSIFCLTATPFTSPPFPKS